MYTIYKKAQGLSLQTIIIALLCLFVLVILIFVFRDKIGSWSASAESCSLKGGECSDATSCGINGLKLAENGDGWNDCSPTQICCATVQIGQQKGEN